MKKVQQSLHIEAEDNSCSSTVEHTCDMWQFSCDVPGVGSGRLELQQWLCFPPSASSGREPADVRTSCVTLSAAELHWSTEEIHRHHLHHTGEGEHIYADS